MYFKNRDTLLHLFLILFVKVFAKDHHCSSTSEDVIIQGETEGYIITRKEGKSYYSNNLLCNWIIQAKPNERILLTVEYSDLQWTQSLSLCLGYDHVDVRDENGTLAAWCGDEFPKEITSRDSWLKIIFQSDESNPYTYVYKGARIKFQTFEKTSCPPRWLDYYNYCYSTTTTEQNWDDSQKECNHRQSNLLSIKSAAEWNFLYGPSDLLNPFKEDFLWTGLNDISNNNKLRWLDGSSLSVEGLETPVTDRYLRCGAMYSRHGQLIMRDCDHLLLFAICKANKGEETRLYPVPQYNKDKASEKDELARRLKLGLIISSVLVLIIIVIGVLCRRRIRGLCKNSGNERPRNADTQLDLDEQPSRGGRGEPDDLPPSYDQLFGGK